jgi:hypothetical protein
MIVRQISADSRCTSPDLSALAGIEPDLVLVFGSVGQMDHPMLASLRASLPKSLLVGCSTAGEIRGCQVQDDSLVITGVRLEHGNCLVHEATAETMADSLECGRALGRNITPEGLRAVLVFAPGVDLNGSALIDGLGSELPAGIPVSGGLAGDGGAFRSTLVLTPSGLHARKAVAVAFYGDALRIGHGSFGGWAPFGPVRKVTRCEGNVLFELDGLPALSLYKEYLGEYADGLPSSGLLFPFEMLDHESSPRGLIRTILGVDEAAGSLVLAGNIDPDGHLRLMHSNREALVDGAEAAAQHACKDFGAAGETLGLLVSCVGRKLVMGDGVDDEVQVVSEILGREASLAGFYSYGEIAPFSSAMDCQLHNQTMTVTWLGEA